MSSKKMTPDEVETYRDDLRELKNNHKPLINMLSQGKPFSKRLFVYDQVFIVYLVAEDYKDTAGAEQVSELISERLAEVCRNRNKQKAKDFNLYSVYMILHSNGHYWNKKDTNFVFKS